jgi:hypothetical protein
MKINDILTEVGRERGLSVRGDISLVGMIGDFPVLVRPIPYGNLSAVCLTLRTGPGDFAALKKAVKSVKGIKPSMLKSPAGGLIQYVIPYSIFKGKLKTTVIAAIDSLVGLAAAHLGPPPKACEVCNKPETGNLVVKGGVPALVCPGCAETMRAKQETARIAYEATSPAYLKGIILGLIGAALGAIVWAVVIVLFKSTYLILAVGIGAMVAFFMKKAIGRVDRLGYVVAAVLVLASIFAGELLAYIWFIGRATGRLDTTMAWHAYVNILLNNPDNLVYTVIFALAGVWIGVATLSKMEKDAHGDDLS